MTYWKELALKILFFLLPCLLTFPQTSAHTPIQEKLIPVGAIDFYGYGGIDIDKLRTALPVHAGDSFPSLDAERAMSPKIRETVLRLTGGPAAAVANVAIENEYLIYIGLAGTTMKKFRLNPEPKGSAQLPLALIHLYDRMMEIVPKAIAAGATEDDSNGYALSSFPELRTMELEIKELATQNENLIGDVLKTASDPKQRVVASYAIAYAQQSGTQIQTLLGASHDANGLVRNNATRALGVIASSTTKTSCEIPAEPFIEMLSSEAWTDRNKAGWVLQSITYSRNPEVLRKLHSEALDSLIEMARWHDSGHAASFRILLGRIGGIQEHG